MTKGTLKSEKGFFVGDLCYALDDKVYHEVWGGADYEAGVYKDPITGFSFAVAGTAHGDGTYCDENGHHFPVDAGNISLMPLELYHGEESPIRLGSWGAVYIGSGEAGFTAYNGVFDISLPDGTNIYIDTNDDSDEDWDW